MEAVVPVGGQHTGLKCMACCKCYPKTNDNIDKFGEKTQRLTDEISSC